MRPKIAERVRAQAFRVRGRSVKEIARMLHVSAGSVSGWVGKVPLSPTARLRLRHREETGGARGRQKILARWQEYRRAHPRPVPEPRLPRPVETFFDRWTAEMAYVLGYFAADGCMFRNPRGSYYIQFTSCDLQLIQTVQKLLGVSNAIEVQSRAASGHQTSYTLQVGSRRIFEKFRGLGFTPQKSLTLRFPLVPRTCLSDFVRGYFDGDGCVIFGRYRRRVRRPARIGMVQFVSGSRRYLAHLHSALLAARVVAGGCLTRGGRAHHLQYSTSDTRRLYKFLYQRNTLPCLERKREKFRRAMEFLGP